MTGTILTGTQQHLLTLLFSHTFIKEKFYLTGGTALAEYYLHHRYSEDLDFFSSEEIDPMGIQVMLKSIAKKAKIKTIDFQQSFNRNLFYLHFNNEVIKTEFTYFPFLQLEFPQERNSIKIDSLIDIAVNKIFTIYQKPRSRDFIDLYLIIKEKQWTLEDLRKKARVKFDSPLDPLQLAQQLLAVETLEDLPRMLISLEQKEWQTFWRNEAGKLKDEVLA